jgi:hypothetical protein
MMKAMKYKLALLLAVLVSLIGGAPTPAKGAGVFIEVGDRPYYNHGPRYWRDHRRYEWIPGHWVWRHHHRYWVHGHYA